MIRPDVVQLRQFYSSPTGRMVRAIITRAILKRWPELHQDMLLGLGYANPFLRPYLKDEHHHLCVVPAMPAAQGAIYWPQHHHNRAVLVDDGMLPFPDNITNRIVMVHALEHQEKVADMLAECWRVMVPGGRMILVVPNRRGLWSGSDYSPFSYGNPYSVLQLKELIGQCRFTYIDHETQLFVWPSPRPIFRKFAKIFELIGRVLLPSCGGVIVMECEKQIYAGLKEPAKRHHAARVYKTAVGNATMLPTAHHHND